MAVAAPKAQHEPQPPWSQIMEMDLQVGHFLRGSNSVKNGKLNKKNSQNHNRKVIYLLEALQTQKVWPFLVANISYGPDEDHKGF